MLKYKDIKRIANSKNIQETVIDKDWILGHFLNAIFHHKEMSEKFIFKG